MLERRAPQSLKSEMQLGVCITLNCFQHTFLGKMMRLQPVVAAPCRSKARNQVLSSPGERDTLENVVFMSRMDTLKILTKTARHV